MTGTPDNTATGESRDVLIVEDHPVVAKVTLDLINVQFPELNTFLAHTAAEAEVAITTQPGRWHRVLLDLNIPGAVGLSTAAMIADAGLAEKCCIVTGSEKESTVAQVQDMGFLGYILKNVPVEEFTNALGRVLQGERVFLAKSSMGLKRPRLTQRQAAILTQVSKGLSSKRIGDKLHITTGTVDNHLSAAMLALGVGTRSAAVVKALELGIIDLDRG